MPPNVVLMIDAENISHAHLPAILDYADQQGQVILRAVYGDWRNASLQQWHDIAQKHDLKVRDYTKANNGKNAADMALIMDAVEVLHRLPVDAFCLVTNDADMVPLCHKLHEAKKDVIGIGLRHASTDLMRACNQFIFLDEFSLTPSASQKKKAKSKKKAKQPNPPYSSKDGLEKLVRGAIKNARMTDDGWVHLSHLGVEMRKLKSDFTQKDYGHSTLLKLIKSDRIAKLIEIRRIKDMPYVRLK